MSLTNCRFYEEKYPEIDSFVMVNVKQVGFASATRMGRLEKQKDRSI
jgi:translation initiation factor 2 alpha subunit (eIF-2alpha)